MSNKTFLRNLSIAGITLSGAIALSSKPAFADTTFECIKAGSGYATIAVTQEGAKTEPLITWNSQAMAGSGFTPQSRCNEVTGRLNTVVANVGGSFSDVLLTTGSVNRLGVVCWVNDEQSGCDDSNVLVTMSPGRDPGKFLANLVNRRANPFEAGVAGQESERRTVVRFGRFVEQELAAARNRPSNKRPSGGGRPIL
ncbi:COP23 domain-containing protein [Microcoleus sp.]|uniref:COP23 domain-containing protein n=1 Tax=Microcoleus sp. TaxID=44472 RepID=UPI0035241CC0